MASQEELRDYFAHFGPVKDARIITDPRGNSRGYGFVTFDSENDASKVLTLKDQELVFKDSKLNVGHAFRKKNNFANGGGVGGMQQNAYQNGGMQNGAGMAGMGGMNTMAAMGNYSNNMMMAAANGGAPMNGQNGAANVNGAFGNFARVDNVAPNEATNGLGAMAQFSAASYGLDNSLQLNGLNGAGFGAMNGFGVGQVPQTNGAHHAMAGLGQNFGNLSAMGNLVGMNGAGAFNSMSGLN